MLELRFDFEKEWAAHGWSIRSRAFYRALDMLYQKHFPTGENPIDRLLSYATESDLQMLSLIGPPTQGNRKRRKSDPTR